MESDTKLILGFSAVLAGLLGTGAVIDYRAEKQIQRSSREAEVYLRGGNRNKGSRRRSG